MVMQVNLHLQPMFGTSNINSDLEWLGNDKNSKTVVITIQDVRFFLDYDQAESIIKELAFGLASLDNNNDND